jgi:hypothetical protein
MKREILTAWVTKYALTEGIEVVEAEWCADISDKMITYGGNGYSRQSAHGNDWHRTPEAALARAEEMRAAKVVSLKKSLAKMERMTFVAPNAI